MKNKVEDIITKYGIDIENEEELIGELLNLHDVSNLAFLQEQAWKTSVDIERALYLVEDLMNGKTIKREELENLAKRFKQ